MDSKHGAAAMIDPADKQTASLPLEQPKRGRGRPATGAALTPAQKQKAYRERQKQLLAEAQNLEAMSRVQEGLNADAESQIRLVSKLLDQERENSERLASKVLELERQIKELKKINVTKIKRHRDDPPISLENGIADEGVWTVEFMAKSLGKRSWTSCEKPMVDFEGVPDKFEYVKRHVDDMQKDAVRGNIWRAVRDDGMIYEAKAPKSKRKQPVKS